MAAFAGTAVRAGAQGVGGTAPPGGAPAEREAARVVGTVYDSLGRRPLAGAVVQVVRASDLSAARSATADSLGRFAVDSVAPGRHLVGFYHPLLDVLGVELAPRELDVPAAGIAGYALATPGPRAIRAAICGAAAPGDSLGVLVGLVRDADTDVPAEGATVTITWNEFVVNRAGVTTERRRVPVPVRESGAYAVCGLPADGPLTASAEAPGRASGLVEVALAPGGIAVQDFAVADSAAALLVAVDSGAAAPDAGASPSAPSAAAPRVARGTARLAGTVRGRNGGPVRGAQVHVWGTGLAARTGDDGTFTLAGLPAGTHTVEVRAVGLEPRRAAVALGSGRTATVALTMAEAVRTLDVVTVRGRRTLRTQALERFALHRRSGFGRFVTALDIERSGALQTTDALRMMPGLRLVPAQGMGYAVRARGGCKPALVLDGMPIFDGADDLDMLVRPQDVMGIEVYTGLGGIPAEWTGLQAGGCGVVAVWTKR